MLRKYRITDTIIAGEKADEIVLRSSRAGRKKLTWEETAREMATAKEDWSEWESTQADGLHEL